MIKVIDVDNLFDKYISDYVYGNIGKVNPEEIENKIPQLYEEFGDTSLKELDGKTPNEYYKQFSGADLVECLKNHLEKGVSVSDFLCEAITSDCENERALVGALEKENSEEFTLYLMNMLGDMGSENVCARYLQFIVWDYSESIRELATELLSPMAEKVKETVLAQFREVEENKKVNLTEILSNCKNDDRVFDILVEQFVKHKENVPLYASYLSKYGDERAIPFLVQAIEAEKISYADFEEIRFAIEALGGEYTKERDFTSDKTYKKIKNIKRK